MKRTMTSILVLGIAVWMTGAAFAQGHDWPSPGTASETLIIPHRAMLSGAAVVSPTGDQANGQADLIFRVYAQATGGKKLFEERHTVAVSKGAYDVAIGSLTPGGLPASIMNSHPVLWVETVRAGDFTNASIGSRTQYMFRRDSTDVAPQSINVDVSLCWTCGGAYPVLSGIIPTRLGASTLERGGSCSGALLYRSDPAPRLCSR